MLQGISRVFPSRSCSNAFFPIQDLPASIIPFVYFNHASSMAVDGLHRALVEMHWFDPQPDLAVVCFFTVMMIVIGTYAFRKIW